MGGSEAGRIRIGVGGWTYAPWRGPFYPDDLTQKRELEYASRKLPSIEINGTFYRTQKPDSFRKWCDETPDDFVFALKGPRYATNRRELATAGDSVERFFTSGVAELGDKLGPVNWQLMDHKAFEPEDFEAFLALLPNEVEGRRIRNAVEVRHDSFRSPDAVALARRYGVALVLAADGRFPQIADATADFVYARIMGTKKSEPLGYSAADLDAWADRSRALAAGAPAEGLATVGAAGADPGPRDVFLYVISGHKVSNPAAATALIERLAA
jgi:uncharacterized protein YecE (DUF72 family)